MRSAKRLKLIAEGTSLNRLFIKMIPPASTAISVPVPIAIPASAAVSAGASFIPSPTIATFPKRLSRLTASAFPSGISSAITSSTPTVFPTASAVRLLSPVSITTFIPMLLSRLTAALLSSFIVSATAIMPSGDVPRKNKSGVFPSADKLSAAFCISSVTRAFSAIKRRLPPESSVPSRIAVTPEPACALKSCTA